jgi:hypothetical protein
MFFIVVPSNGYFSRTSKIEKTKMFYFFFWQRLSLNIVFICIWAAVISGCFGAEKLPCTIYAVGLIMRSYFLKWMLGFRDLKRNINVDFSWFYDTTSPISHLKSSLIVVLAIVISLLLGHSLVALIAWTITRFHIHFFFR